MVPQGGLFWDGRADTLQAQASGPMVNPVEMANASLAQVADKLAHTSYKGDFEKLFGPRIFDSGDLAVSEAMFAVARYQVEEPGVSSVHEQIRLLARRQGAADAGGIARTAPLQRSRQGELRGLSCV